MGNRRPCQGRAMLCRQGGQLARPAYDASRSSAEVKVTSRGLRWLSAMVLVDVAFAGRIWAELAKVPAA